MEEATDPITKRKCFVISPIGDEGSDARVNADQLSRHVIHKALDNDYDILRGDEDENPGAITPQIVASILEADLIVADLSGFNPNVYYEVAIAHGYNKPTVHLQNKHENPAFDLKDARLIRYDLHDPDAVVSAQITLRKYATFAVENPQKVVTPLSSAQLFVRIDQSDDVAAQALLEVSEQLRRLQAEVRASHGNHSGIDRSADIRAIRQLITRAARRNVLVADDFRELVSSSTSDEFDEWIFSLLTKVDGGADSDILLGG